MIRVTEPSFKFWFDEKYYTVQGAETMARMATPDDMATMRAEYTRMRDVAQKRIKRLGKEYPESKAYSQHAEGFPKLRELDPRDFAKAFSTLAKFVRAKTSTVTGQRVAQAKTTATLNKAIGADEEDEEGAKKQAKVTKQNYWRVIKILDESRRLKVTYDSDKIVTLAETTLSFTKDQFDVVLDNLEKLIPNSDEVEGSLSEYMKEQGIQDYQKVNVDDFIEQLGW